MLSDDHVVVASFFDYRCKTKIKKNTSMTMKSEISYLLMNAKRNKEEQGIWHALI